MNRPLYVMESNGGGGGGSEEPIPFGEAFGINPDGSPYEAPAADPTPDPDPTPTPDPTPEPGAPADPPADPPAAPAGETPDQQVARLFAGKYKTVEEMERGYKELERTFSSRPADGQQPGAQPVAEAPKMPLFKGDTAEIKTEADLYGWAAADPEAAAMFAMENHDRLNPEQLDTVMNNWIANQPWKATQTILAWNTQMMRDEQAESRRVQDEHYFNQIRDTGIEQAIAKQPLLQQHAKELGEYIEANQHLMQMVDGAKTAEEVSNALTAIFYMYAGPQIASQALEHRVALEVAETERKRLEKEAATAAAANVGRATSISRNTAPPPSDGADYDEQIRDRILNPGKAR